jgi:hypothetical protein
VRGGIEIGPSAQLIDALGDLRHVLALFVGVFVKFVLDGFAGEAGGDDGIHGVPQNADNLGSQHGLENVDRLDIALVSGRNSAFLDARAGCERSSLTSVRKGDS